MSANASQNVICQIPGNPDIAGMSKFKCQSCVNVRKTDHAVGIGVRTAVYIQATLAIINFIYMAYLYTDFNDATQDLTIPKYVLCMPYLLPP